MSLVQTSISRPKPGRRTDGIALAVEASKLLERHGAPESRLLLADTAGEATGTYVFTTEFENAEAWGKLGDSLASDAELEALMDRIDGPDSPITMEAMSIGTEIPLGREGSSGQGAVVEAYISRCVPGRFEAALELAATVFDFVEAHGGTGCRVMQLTSAGMLTECLVASWELESMVALGRLGDAYGAEPEGQRIFGMLMGADSPITPVSSGIYRAIPL
jgi:hypothetical protein